MGVTRLGIGMAAVVSRYGIGDQAGADADALARAVVEAGVGYIDTAAAYGESESAIGRLRPELERLGIRLCTKAGAGRRTVPETLLGEARQSVARLGGGPVDTLLLHSAHEDVLMLCGLSQALEAISRAGLARRTGASTYGSAAARVAIQQAWCHTVQIEFSVLNQQVLTDVESVRRPGQEVVVRSVLCKGLLTERADAAGALAAPIADDLMALRALASSWDLTLPELAIRFALDTQGVDVVLVGVASADELRTALGAAGKPALTAAQMAHLQTFDRSALDCVHPERWPKDHAH